MKLLGISKHHVAENLAIPISKVALLFFAASIIFCNINPAMGGTEWGELSQDKKRCLQIGLKKKNTSIESLAQRGIKPSDNRLVGFHRICDTVLNKKLRSNYKCQLKDRQGNKVNTVCNEYMVVIQNGQIKKINKVSAIHALFNGIDVKFYNEQVPLSVQNNPTPISKTKPKLAVSSQKKSQETPSKNRRPPSTVYGKDKRGYQIHLKGHLIIELVSIKGSGKRCNLKLRGRNNTNFNLEGIGFWKFEIIDKNGDDIGHTMSLGVLFERIRKGKRSSVWTTSASASCGNIASLNFYGFSHFLGFKVGQMRYNSYKHNVEYEGFNKYHLKFKSLVPGVSITSEY